MRIFGFLLALFLTLPLVGSAQVSGVTVETSLEQDHYLPDEDLVVTVTIINRSGQTLELGEDNSWLNFSIQGEKSIIVQRLGDVPVQGPFRLKSGQSEVRLYNLTPYYTFRQQGRYSLSVSMKVPQWKQDIASKPLVFSIMNAVAVTGLPNLEFGVPPRPGTPAGPPEVRKYTLEKSIYLKQPKLYFRVTDVSGRKTFRVFPIGPYVSFSQPEVQIDGESRLHLLYQFYAKSFCYCVIDPDGRLVVRQIHDYSQTRPTLRTDTEGQVYVGGGIRRYTMSDLPTPVPVSFPSTNDVVNTNQPSK